MSVADLDVYTVSVRALCDFTARCGDLDLRFTPAPSAEQGMAGHKLVRSRRAPGYQQELSLCGTYQDLRVRGRADGYDPVAQRLEEIKTHRGDVARIPQQHRHLHQAQLMVYGALLCAQSGMARIKLALVYFDLTAERETVFESEHEADTLQSFFEQSCSRFLDWARQERQHRKARDAALLELAFPMAFRPGQRQMAKAVFQAARSGRCLTAEAPTGIGKTLATVFPLIKAAPEAALDKVFYLAAKTSGRALGLDALKRLSPVAGDSALRVLELVARDDACEHPDLACHGQSCPLARGFYDRLPAARAAAVQVGFNDRASLRELALAHDICPYYLSQEMARWSDAIVGDYNHWFDASAMLHAMCLEYEWRVGVLVDEAHNLVERARKMYSAELDQRTLTLLAKTAAPALRKCLTKLARAWSLLDDCFTGEYGVLEAVPERWLLAVREVATKLADFFAQQPAHVDAALTQAYFDLLFFMRLAECFDQHSIFDVSRDQGGQLRCCLRNVVPAPFLRQRFAASHTTTLFSATLSPWHFYADMLGLPEDCVAIDVESPFVAEQLQVKLIADISTRYRDRPASVVPIAELMAEQFARQPGNYMAFFSSFEYLEQVLEVFCARHPAIAVWAQTRRMEPHDREQFLARFAYDSQGIAFAVLGGRFGEAIDLPGKRLIGAFIATLGLPQINPVNECMRERIGRIFSAGYDYTYLYPGLQKVVQAAGRVIRTREDRGVVYLIDDRYARPEVRRLLPLWWRVERGITKVPRPTPDLVALE